MAIKIIGCGGIGFWLAVGLSRTGLEVTIFDDDDLTGGLGHTRLPVARSNTHKVDLLIGFLRTQMGGNMPTTVFEKFSGKETEVGDLVVDCSDMSGKARGAIYRRVIKAGGRYVRVSYDGANHTVVVAEGLPITVDQAAAGYSSVPSLALSLMAGGVGAECVAEMANKPVGFVEFQVSLADYLPVGE